MITQVIFKIDKKIKEQAQKKAKARGLTYSDVLKMASYQYVEGNFEPALFPTISVTEQRDIEARYGKKPTGKYIRSATLEI